MVPQSETKPSSKRNHNRSDKPIVIGPSTPHEFTSELLTPFGGFLLFVKMLAALQFEKLFEETFVAPERKPQHGHYVMFKGIIFLLVIGFQRIFHFSYISQEPMLLGVLGLTTCGVICKRLLMPKRRPPCSVTLSMWRDSNCCSWPQRLFGIAIKLR